MNKTYHDHFCKTCEQIKILLRGMFYENGLPSFTRVLALLGYITFIIGSFYLMIKGIHWEDYSIFASYTGGGGVALQFANKFIDSKYNSAIGSYQQKDYGECKTIPQSNSSSCSNCKDPNIGTK